MCHQHPDTTTAEEGCYGEGDGVRSAVGEALPIDREIPPFSWASPLGQGGHNTSLGCPESSKGCFHSHKKEGSQLATELL